MKHLFTILFFTVLIMSGCIKPSATANQEPTDMPEILSTSSSISDEDRFVYDQNSRLGRGINLGNALEAPVEGEWGMVLREDYFQIIKDGGFDSIRVPIRWSAHALQDSPYTINPAFFDRIDWVVEKALQNDLAVIINMHHYEELIVDPSEHKQRFLTMWQQISDHYQGAPDSVYFEPLNEPNGAITRAGTWNNLAAEVIREIRQTNQTRTIIIGPGDWNSITSLNGLRLPEDERNLIVTVHYYQPFQFTHQGAEWVDGSDPWLGTTWTGTPKQTRDIASDLDLALKWGRRNNRPIFLGEFGAYSRADIDSRILWTAFVARQAEQRGISWAYWEFGAGFGAYDRDRNEWIEPIHTALIP